MGQSFTNLIYHIVFSTKDRQPLITEAHQSRLYEYIGGTMLEASKNCDQGGSEVYVTRLLGLRPSKPDRAGDADLSLRAMRSGHPPRPQRGESNRTKGAGSPFGERARSRRRRTENLPGGRPGIPRQNAIAFGGGRISM